MSVSATSLRPQGILPGGCVLRPMNEISGKEFKTVNDLEAFVKKHKGQVSLRPGSSFEIYLPKSAGSIYGSHRTLFEGFNQKTPLKTEVIAGKAAPIREPGDWVRVSVPSNAKAFAKDHISLVSRESIMCRPPSSKTLVGLTVTVVP